MRFGVVGTGVIGRLRARSIRENPGTELVSVADPAKAVADATASGLGAKSYADHRALLDAGGIDALVISSPLHLHEEQCADAFAAGLHVLCEKPLANSHESCMRIIAASQKAGKTLAVGFNHRYYPAIKFVKQAIVNGRIGKLDHLRVFGGHDGLNNFRADWMYKAAYSGGGAMMDAGIHMTDLARYLAGEVTSVYGVATNGIWKVDGSEDDAMAIFRTADGVPIQYEATWTEWKGYRFYVEAYGDLGMAKGYYAPMFNMLVTHEKPGARRRKEMRFYPGIILREKLKSWESTAYLAFVEELADFLKHVEGKPSAIADAWSGARSVEIAEAVYRCAKDGRPVELTRRPG